MKNFWKAMFYGTLALATVTFTACNNDKKGEIMIDGKAYAISIGEVTQTGDGCTITLNMGKEAIQKFQETADAPFWLGTISDEKYVSANGRVLLKNGVLFQIDVPDKIDKIIVYTPEQKSVVEFDGTTKQVLPSSAEEFKDLLNSQNTELCKRYKDYQPLDSAQNKAGISFEIVSTQVKSNTFGIIKYSNDGVKGREGLADDFMRHFFAVDADNLTKSLTVHLRGGHNLDNTEFFGIIMFDGDVEAKYAFVGFEGLSEEVSAQYATPSLFFIVELGDKFKQGDDTLRAIKSYCKTPYLAGDIFSGLKTDK